MRRLPFIFIPTIFLVLLCSFSVKSQKNPIILTENDKAQIIKEILKRENFNDTDSCCEKNKENFIYLIGNNISVERLPKRKNITFVLITQQEADEKSGTGIEYFSFSDFEVKKSSVEVYFFREYKNIVGKHSNAA